MPNITKARPSHAEILTAASKLARNKTSIHIDLGEIPNQFRVKWHQKLAVFSTVGEVSNDQLTQKEKLVIYWRHTYLKMSFPGSIKEKQNNKNKTSWAISGVTSPRGMKYFVIVVCLVYWKDWKNYDHWYFELIL